MSMKLLFVFLLVALHGPESHAQAIIEIGSRKIVAETVDSSTFSIYGKWRIIHRDYVAETPHSYDLLPLELLNPEVFTERDNQGKTSYGNIVEFSSLLFYPYAPYMPRLLINPFYLKKYEIIGIGKNGTKYLYVHKFQDKKYLTLQVYCSNIRNDEFSIIVLNNNTIVVLNNNSYTYLERYNGKEDWIVDQSGYFVQELMGLAHFDIFVPQEYINKSYHLDISFQANKKNVIDNQYVSVLGNNTCFYREEKVISSKDTKSNEKISLKQLPSNIVRIHGSTKSQLNRWRVRWKFVPN